MLYRCIHASRLNIAGTKKGGFESFIVNNQSQTSATIYIKVVLTVSTSVLMAEAAALALAARIISALDIHAPTFLSDNQQLLHSSMAKILTILLIGKSSTSRKASSILHPTEIAGF